MNTDIAAARQRWVNYNLLLIEKFKEAKNPPQSQIDKLNFYGVDYLIDFESEPDIDPENKDGGIITIDTVTGGYIDSFLGRWLIQSNNFSEEDFIEFIDAATDFYTFLGENKLYKERSTSYNKLMRHLTTKRNTYIKRYKDFRKIEAEKADEEKYLDLMRDWEYEDI